MISIELTAEPLDALYKEMMSNPSERSRKKCMVLYLKGLEYSHIEIASIVRVDQDTVTAYIKKYVENALQGLLEDNYHTPVGQLEPHIEKLKKIFKDEPPHTVNSAIDVIEKHTGVTHRSR